MDTKNRLWLPGLITLAAILLTFLVFIIKKKKKTSNTSLPPPSNTSLPPSNTCSSSTSPPAAAGWNYEVFLSFRGEDTRKKFTDYLYCDLSEKGIHTFRDDKALRLGENISEILNAIEQSKISIPIFSEDYASSEWCLRELTKMVECMKTREHIIIPIFYDVKPSDVREQKGSYEKAFRKHEKDFDGDTVQGWKDALKEVGGLTGRERKKFADGHEGELVKDIALEVWEKLKRNSLDVNYERLVGIDDHVEEMMKLLSVNSIDVRIVGIHGMGGIGKTTIARVIYNNLSQKKSEFESCCFLADVREKAQQRNGLVDLQNQLVSSILKQGHSVLIRSMDDGLNAIKQRFSGKKVLVVVDDVDQRDHLHAFALLGRCDWFGLGSRIIVTTRNEEVLNLLEVDCWTYKLEELDDSQSLQLFSRHAFRMDRPPQDYYSLSKDVVFTTGGLPLALEVIGSLFISIGKEEWEDTINKLKSIPHKDVTDRLKISYDALDDNQQEVFLDIACLFIGVDERIAVHMWKFGKAEIGALCRRLLVKIGDNNELMMHDQLRDLGRDIVRQENVKEPGKRSRVWFHEDAIDVLERHAGTTKVEAICVDFQAESQKNLRRLTNTEFADLSNLRFLQVDYANLEGNFEGLLSKLKWLRWNGCPQNFGPTNFHLKNLVILDLSWSEVRKEWEGWNYIKNATKLKVLNLTGCKNLITTPDFSSYATLERLILKTCWRLVDIDRSIGALSSLTSLYVHDCGKLQCLPALPSSLTSLDVHNCRKPSSLTSLDVHNCRKLQCLPALPASLTSLHVDNCGKLQCLPALPSSLTSLDVHNCEQLQCLPALPSSLASLTVIWCKQLQCLPALPSSLTSLHVKYCGRLKCLPTLPSRLTSLNIHNCGQLQCLPALSSSLTSLDVDTCEQLQCLPTLPSSLTSLNVQYCKQLQCLPDLPSSLTSLYVYLCTQLQCLPALPSGLMYLNVKHCEPMERLPDLSNLKNLPSLCVIECLKLREIPCLGRLELLTELHLDGCESLETLPDLSNFKKVRKLTVTDCKNLNEITGLDRLESLEYLNMSGCTSLARLPDLSKLEKLEGLNLSSCEKIHEIEGLEDLKSLKKLELSWCTALENAPDLSRLTNLEKLELRRCKKLGEIRGLEKLKLLPELNLMACTALERIPDLSKLTKLRKLNLSDCEKLSEICGLEELKLITELNLSYCKSLETLPDLSNLKKVRNLSTAFCKNLKEITGLDRLESLEDLNMSYCDSLERLPDLSKLEKLEGLNLRYCKKIRKIEGLEALKSLKKLDLSNCTALEEALDLSRLTNLEKLNLSECKKLGEIRGLEELELLSELNLVACKALERILDLSKLTKLRKLSLRWCDKLSEIWGLEELKLLEWLDLSWCMALERIPDLSKLTNLKELDLSRCDKLGKLPDLPEHYFVMH
ncbi:disease resistance protein RUN1-like isoform X2 [Cornus florida]|uniref:disease resistance protein RUN1-like isoform X2 n=1 Tax=Cornus florida TaxID=4283 RepID=UPI0028971B41|nr:disease resistance protein RUN1-like isoform X2 [Cornus florida]